MFLLKFLFALLALFTSVLATPAGFQYPETEWEYTVHPHRGGHEVSLKGTVQEQLKQMKELFPDFDPLAKLPQDELVERDVKNKNDLLCNPMTGQASWKFARKRGVLEGINYLRTRDLCGVDGHSCARISCDREDGIWLCNDNDYRITPKCDYIASYAFDIIQECRQGNMVCGQRFDSDRYNVPVHVGDC
ncbi:hypothetical protein HYALB_00004263 [Hymenoscyphus albidus]|uniref:Uncharacterized protein n=1 Tax=Hymenoscyphus albidus TaxID=595503 RepID=A0A9N9LMH4_9HELO|nr:hypothetical protein HYALB_00004263 [Hymenoscyphus albidus]